MCPDRRSARALRSGARGAPSRSPDPPREVVWGERGLREDLALKSLRQRNRAADLLGILRVPARRVLGAHVERLDLLSAAAVGHVDQLLLRGPRRELRIEHGVDRMPAGDLDAGTQAFGRENDSRKDVVIAGIAREERAAPDVV